MTRFSTLQLFHTMTLFGLVHCSEITTNRTAPLSICAAHHPNDVLCNNSTRTFACVCYSADSGLSRTYPDCYSFVTGETLPALRLVLTSFKDGAENFESLSKEVVPLNHKLVTREYYLKRKISSIISSYCSEDAHKCKSISRSIHPSNVIILRLSCAEDDSQKFVVDYTIAKTVGLQNLSETSVLEPGLILAALRPKLQKTIPYKIIDHEPHAVIPFAIDSERLEDEDTWSKLWKEHVGLVIALIAIGVLVVVICFVAILKNVRNRAKRQHGNRSPKTKSKAALEKSTGYGAIDEEKSPLQKSKPPEVKGMVFTTIDDIAEQNGASSMIVNGSFAYFPQTPTSPAANGYSLTVANDSQDFHPQPPEPPASMSRPTPTNRTLTKTVLVTTSQSLQLQNSSKSGQRQDGVKKAITVQAFGEQPASRYSIGSIDLSEAPTPPSILLEENRRDSIDSPTAADEKAGSQDNNESDRSRTSTIVQVPVLIVPAMAAHRDDQDYGEGKEHDDLTLRVDEKFIEYDRKNVNSEPEVTNRRTKEASQVRSAVSEECLLPKDSADNVLSPDQPISSVSSDTGNSEDPEGNLDHGGFHLMMSGIGYQPLRESSWSVPGGNDEEMEDNDNNN